MEAREGCSSRRGAGSTGAPALSPRVRPFLMMKRQRPPPQRGGSLAEQPSMAAARVAGRGRQRVRHSRARRGFPGARTSPHSCQERARRALRQSRLLGHVSREEGPRARGKDLRGLQKPSAAFQAKSEGEEPSGNRRGGAVRQARQGWKRS